LTWPLFHLHQLPTTHRNWHPGVWFAILWRSSEAWQCGSCGTVKPFNSTGWHHSSKAIAVEMIKLLWGEAWYFTHFNNKGNDIYSGKTLDGTVIQEQSQVLPLQWHVISPHRKIEYYYSHQALLSYWLAPSWSQWDLILSVHDMDFRHISTSSHMSFVVLLAGTILVAIGSYLLSGHDMDFRRGYGKL
jgi:hypothetical protein